jgi:hypothetical protein
MFGVYHTMFASQSGVFRGGHIVVYGPLRTATQRGIHDAQSNPQAYQTSLRIDRSDYVESGSLVELSQVLPQ